jgi:hypothetical protein
MFESTKRPLPGHSLFNAMPVAFAAMLLIGCRLATDPPEPVSFEPADLVLTNGKVYTVDASMPWAEAVAIRDGRIAAAGDAEDAPGWTDAETRVVDLGGKLVLPAFGDAHIHPTLGGLTFSQCSLHRGENVEEYLQIIASCNAESPGTGVLYGRGWAPGLFPPDGVPRKELLDAISTDRPLVFSSTGGHSLWVNSKALELAGIARDTPDPPNGRIDRDPATGEPIGGLQEAAKDLMMAHVPPPTVEAMEHALAYTADHLNRLGVTQWLDAGVGVVPVPKRQILEAYKAARDHGKLNVHVALSLKWENELGLEQLPGLLETAELARAMGFKADSIKLYIDGVIAQRTAAMLEPYSDSPGEKGELQIPPDVFYQAVTTLDKLGFQAYVHAIGDRATRTALDAFAAARETNGATDNRHMIAHLNVISPADLPRFGELDVIANFQPLWATMNPYIEMTAVRVGPERMAYHYPSKSLLDAGAMLAYGADWPVASANPLEGIEVALTRKNPGAGGGEPLLPHEGVTLEEAIQAYTINAAYASHLEVETGSITPGKSADLIVLDQDIFTIPVQEISDTRVLLTLFRGAAVHDELPAF